MTKIDIISGFLGAGKTTFIKKLLKEAIAGEKVVLIENEFGEIGIDGGFLKDSGIENREMNSGCICCSLVGDFGRSLNEVLTKYTPDRVIIEPSGVGKLSDVIAAVQNAHLDDQLNSFVTVVDALKAKMYLKNFGEFFENQVTHAGAILLSRTAECPEKRLDETVAMLRGLTEHARIVTTPWKDLTGEQLLAAMDSGTKVTVAILQNSFAEDIVADVFAGHDNYTVDQYEDQALLYQALASGRCDVAVCDMSNAKYQASLDSNYIATGIAGRPQNYGAGVQKGDQVWLNYVNTVLQDAMSGATYQSYIDAFEQWFGVKLDPPKTGKPAMYC